MTDPVLTVNRVPVDDTVRSHPLSTQPGIAMLSHLIEADQVWSSCTKPQRAMLAALCPPVAAVLLERGSITAADMPALPGRVTVAMRSAMHRRGLVDEQGRLTACAVHAWFYTPRAKGGGLA